MKVPTPNVTGEDVATPFVTGEDVLPIEKTLVTSIGSVKGALTVTTFAVFERTVPVCPESVPAVMEIVNPAHWFTVQLLGVSVNVVVVPLVAVPTPV